MTYVTVNVDVEVDLGDVETRDLVNELHTRNYNIADFEIGEELDKLLNQIWLKRRLNKDFDQELDQLLYKTLGKVL